MTEFAGISRGTMADRVYGEMRAAILDGSLEAGTELNQVGLARQFQVSRVPVREALRRLQAEHLVTATPYQQLVVTAIDQGALLELMEIRAVLEVFAVRQRVGHCDSDVIASLRALNERLRKQKNTLKWFHGDIEFHHVLNGPGSEAAKMVRGLRERVHRYMRTVASTRERQLEACDEHDAIIDALEAGDEAALETAVRSHIEHTRNVLAAHLKQTAEPTTPESRVPSSAG